MTTPIAQKRNEMPYVSVDVLNRGDQNGNHMILRIRLSSNREIFAFATENNYGREWDLGPTWNYVIDSGKPFLLDAGRRGLGPKLLDMIECVGIGRNDLDFVLLSHGHEDHDGGLFQVIKSTSTRVVAHETYDTLIRISPTKAPSRAKEGFPGSCWHCNMPEFFSQKHCLDYHKEKQGLKITKIDESNLDLADGITVFHVPGHSPDSLALLIDDEVLLAGDTILPGITPHPTQEKHYSFTKPLLPSKYVTAEKLYGLRAYIRSLKELKRISKESRETFVLPGHRLFYDNKWNFLGLDRRINELIEHHIQRCSDILDILREGPKTEEEIAKIYFEPKLLEGFGIKMATNEVLSHCELLEVSKDVVFGQDGKIARTERWHFESFINDLH